MNILVCVLVLCASAVFAEEEGGFPMLELANDELTIGLYLPDAEKGYYRGTRFDWSGIIERVEYKGHRFYGAWRFPHDPTGHDFVSGPAEEFGIPTSRDGAVPDTLRVMPLPSCDTGDPVIGCTESLGGLEVRRPDDLRTPAPDVRVVVGCACSPSLVRDSPALTDR